tara:strand:- start:1694 stop:2944 length:1251 start_codon:yes stop_codon:yes gene_type:complete
LQTSSSFWTKSKKIKIEKNLEIEEIFKQEKILENEFNSNLKINLSSTPISNSFKNNLDNNNGRINYTGKLKNTSRYKFSKIENFNQFEPEIVFDKDNVIFFDNKGSIIKFDNSSKLIWKKNFYTKSEKKINPILFFGSNKDTLIVADSVAKYYAININNGELLWSKYNSSPFNSQIKTHKNKFFVIDFENILRCFSIKDGNEIWNFKTEKSFTKSQKKLSLVISDNKLYFNNSIGDISAVDINNGSLLWQTPSQKSLIYEEAFSLQTSDLITDKKSIFFSNNKNDFFSLDIGNGIINWKQKINSNLRPTFVDQLVFTVSNEGFLIIIDSKNGNILRITDVFEQFKKKKRKKIKPVGFILGVNDIYLTTNHGRLIIIDIISGKIKSILKIDNELISRPFVLNQDLYIIKNNSIIKLN